MKQCHFCNEDLSKNGTPKYLTHFSHELPIGAILCSKCFERDFGLSHYITKVEREKRELTERHEKEQFLYKKLLGNLYIKICL